MIKKCKVFKSAISVLLVLAIFAFKVVDLHKYVHDKDLAKGSHCELCLLNLKQKQHLDFTLPVAYNFKLEQPDSVYATPLFSYTEFKKVCRFPFGISLNKAPPSIPA